ncbi:MAG: hypothetical protein NT005_09295 [Spirochaetes bacterium]|nr:hypothetical protein [Spirochaetota bacterium]
MTIKDPDIFRLIEKISEHYQNNISNRFVRKALMILDLQQSQWEKIENLTGKSDYYKTQGFQFDELYEMILATAHFIYQARIKIVPNARSVIAQGADSFTAKKQGAPDQDRVLRDMAAQNFPVNLGIFSDLVNELYMKTTGLDRIAHEKKKPVYERIPDLKDLGRYLVTS